MKKTVSSSTARLILVGSIVVTAAVYALIATSCSDRVSGTRFQNQPPVVQFVNVPPDGIRTSRNPVVYWFGTDADGQVKAFRYIVRTVSELNGLSPEDFASDSLPNYDSSRFVYLSVTVEDPKTANAVQMSADLSDPVRRYIEQYIFLQAFDDQGAGSAFVWKMMFRNDNPPQAFVSVLQGTTIDDPYINSVFPGGAITGVRVGWRGEDLIDYPADPPPFEFRWKFFGPYAYDTASTSDELDQLQTQFVKRVFVSSDAQVYFIGNNDTIFRCDTTFVPPNVVIDCDTVLVDTITRDGPLGRLDRILTVYDTAFTNSALYKVVDSSPGWLMTTRDSFYNVFKDAPSAVTRQEAFVFWVTCRDDALVQDLAPGFQTLYVIDPQYERDVLVIDFTKVSPNVRYNAPFRLGNAFDTVRDSARNYWANVIRKWDPTIDYSKRQDYLYPNGQNDKLLLEQLLKYKLLILYNDNVRESGISDQGQTGDMGRVVYTAIDAGINAWLTMRTPIYGTPSTSLASLPLNPAIDAQYRRYFGVQNIVFSGWLPWLTGGRLPPVNKRRIEDFVGAYSLSTAKWPDLDVDTALLHRRINWQPAFNPENLFSWIDTIAAVPEVDWTSRTFGTEPMFLYKSRFGSRGHFLGDLYTFDGTPVAHRLDAGLFRTVHFNFTPLAMDTIAMQQVIDTVLNWLFDKYLKAPPTTTRYPEAAIKLSTDDVRRNFEVRQQQMREQEAWRHQRLDD